MPIFDYKCPDCNRTKELLTLREPDGLPLCVKCTDLKGEDVIMNKLPSAAGLLRTNFADKPSPKAR